MWYNSIINDDKSGLIEYYWKLNERGLNDNSRVINEMIFGDF